MPECILFIGTGLFFILIGYAIGIKGRISLLHSYHYRHVKDEDKKAYTKVQGSGLGLIGLGFVGAAILRYVTTYKFALYGLTIGFIVGLIICVYGQYKYNGSIMG